VTPRFHYGVDGMLRLCNGSVTVSTVMARFDWPYIYKVQHRATSLNCRDVKEEEGCETPLGRIRSVFDYSLIPSNGKFILIAFFNSFRKGSVVCCGLDLDLSGKVVKKKRL